MNKKSIALTGVLFVVLMLVSFLVDGGRVQGIADDADITLNSDANSYVLGQDIEFSGDLDFQGGETITIHGVTLEVDGPQAMSVTLPVMEGNYDLSSETGVSGTLLVDVSWNNVTEVVSGALPGANQQDPYGGQFGPTGPGATIAYDITWTPPVFLEPAPNFTLIPDFDVMFPIPTLAGPGAQAGTILPHTALQFAIPSVSGTSSAAELPDADFAFDVPQVVVSTNAAVGIPDLPNTSSDPTDGAFDIPTLSVASSTLPDLSAGNPDLAFNVPASAASGGMASDGTDFWIISKGTGAGGKDQIVKVDSDGNVDTSFGTSGFVDGPSNNLDAMAYLNGSLWVAENQWRCNDTVDPDHCDFQHRIFEMDPASPPANDAAWGALGKLNLSDQFEQIGGIAAEGAGASGTLWVGNQSGWRFFEISQAGAELNEVGLDSFNDTTDALAFNEDFLYTSKNGTVIQWSTSGEKQQDFNTGLAITIRGMTFVDSVLYMSTTGGEVYAAFVGESVSTIPRGMAYSSSTASVGEALWILVDGTPFDKILKVDPSDGSLITSFGTNGGVDAPSDSTEGITFLGGSLYIVANDSVTRRLYSVNALTGNLSNTYDLQTTADIFDEIGGITNDGTNLVVYSEGGNSVWILDITGQPAGNEQAFPCCPSVFGARGITYHSGRQQYFAAKNSTLITLDSTLNFQSEQSLQLDGGAFTGIEGMVFNQDVMYVARNDAGTGKVSVGALRTSVTTQPRGMAWSADGSAYLGSPIGEALWVVVDGAPTDKILKVDSSTGQLDVSFGTNGAVDAPSDEVVGITFFDSTLWVGSNEGFDKKLYQINATNGSVIGNINLSLCPDPCSVFDNIGGVANDGTSLIVFTEDFDRALYLEDDGSLDEEKFIACCPPPGAEGANAVTYRSSAGQLVTAKDANIKQYALSGNELREIDTFSATADSGSTTIDSIEGMVFDPGAAGDGSDELLYFAHFDSANSVGKIYTAVIPSSVTTDPQGLAYDSVNQELYILVDGAVTDHIIVVDPTDSGTAAIIRDFEAPENDTFSITYLAGSLYVMAQDIDACCPSPTTIYELDPSNGSVLGQVDVGSALFSNKAMGLTNNGVDLLAVPEFGSELVVIDPSDGGEEERIFLFDPNDFNFFEDGYEGLAYRDSEDEFVAVKGTDVFRFNEDGALIEELDITSGIDELQGAVFVGDTLYMAEADTNTIQVAVIPLPPNNVTEDPLGMATDGTDLYLVLDGSSSDQIVKLDTNGSIDTTWGGGDGVIDSPGAETAGIAYFTDANGSYLYVVTNDTRTVSGGGSGGDPDDGGFGGGDPDDEGFGGGGPGAGGFFQVQDPIIHQIDATTGEVLDDFEILVQNPFGPPMPLSDTVSALGNDGTHLYAGVEGDGFIKGVWFKIDPANPDAAAEPISAKAEGMPFMEGFDSFELTTGPEFPIDRQLVASGSVSDDPESDTIARFDPATGEMADQYTLSGSADIKGMAYIGLTLYMADDDSDSILGTALHENTIELTIAGIYTGDLVTSFSPTIGVTDESESAQIAFNINRNSNMVVELTSPVDGFVATSSAAIIAGRVSDPAVDEVEVGIQLPFTQLFGDNADSGTSDAWDVASETGGSASWHIACLGDAFPARVSSPNCSWRYGNSGQPNFDTGSRTAGSITTASAFDVNAGTILEFTTGYLAEPSPDVDLMTVEVAPVATGEFRAIAMIVGHGFGGSSPPSNAHPSFQFIELDPLFINPQLEDVTIDLSAFAGDRVRLRFSFDSVDQHANQGEGWYLDDIAVLGAGTKTIVINTTALTPPVTVGSTTYYREFSTPFTLAEGQNIVGALAEQPYSPFLSHLATATGFVDQKEPTVTLSGIPGATSELFHTLQGTVDDDTFESLVVSQTAPGGSPVEIFTLNSMPEDGTFSVPVSLGEGTTVFEAVATDGGGLETSTSLQVTADITAPTASIKVVTVTSEGEAQVGDQYFVVVAAQDPLSGVDMAIDIASGEELEPMGQVPAILREMHGLALVGSDPTTHVRLASVQSGTPVGVNTVSVKVVDNAGNEAVVNGTLDVVSARTNRNYFLFPGINYMGLALIPDDPSLDNLMNQDVTSSVASGFAAAMGGTVTLGDVIETTAAFNDSGDFIVHTPSASADSLTLLEPFQGMIVETKATDTSTGEDIFKKVSVEGFTAQQSVPIRINIQGVFFSQDDLPPGKTLRNGYNLIAPHILEDTLFDTVYRGALIPQQLAVSAITFERRTDAVQDGTDMEAELFEGFVTESLGGLLKPVLSYWTFVVDDPNNPVPPTITP